jgi:hypothetical protein
MDVLYKPNDTLTYSCWVPQDCSNAGDKKQLYALNKELLGLEFTRNLMFNILPLFLMPVFREGPLIIQISLI